MDTIIQLCQQGKTDKFLKNKGIFLPYEKELYEYFTQFSSFFVFLVYLELHMIKEDFNELLLGYKKMKPNLIVRFLDC
jgi:hypothetical protein